MVVWCGKEYSQQMAIGLRYIHGGWKYIHGKIRDNMKNTLSRRTKKIFEDFMFLCPRLSFPSDSEIRNNVKGNGS